MIFYQNRQVEVVGWAAPAETGSHNYRLALCDSVRYVSLVTLTDGALQATGGLQEILESLLTMLQHDPWLAARERDALEGDRGNVDFSQPSGGHERPPHHTQGTPDGTD